MLKNKEGRTTIPPSVSSWCVNVEELPQHLLQKQRDWKRMQYGSKSIIEGFLTPEAGFFPERLVIPRSIISVNDKSAIRKKLKEGVERNYSMGVRTVADRQIFGGAKLEWDLGIDTDERVDGFLYNTLPRWLVNAALNNYEICQLIVMNNPSEIGIKEDKPNQFVFRVRWDDFDHGDNLSSRLLVEMALGTNKLRTLDQRMEDGSDTMIRYQLLYRPTGYIDGTELQVGSAYRKNSSSGQVGNLITNEPLSKIRLSQIEDTSAETVLSVISQLHNLIENPDTQFLKRLEFFASQGLNIVEFQGYVNSTRQRKMFIYGLRGQNDDTKTGLHV